MKTSSHASRRQFLERTVIASVGGAMGSSAASALLLVRLLVVFHELDDGSIVGLIEADLGDARVERRD